MQVWRMSGFINARGEMGIKQLSIITRHYLVHDSYEFLLSLLVRWTGGSKLLYSLQVVAYY